jgi:predicted AlkP superfamily pyrophosphatase or phosphodiesterase
MYGELRDTLGHFPLKHFWGPLAGLPSTAWIAASAVWAARKCKPNLFYIYLPHLDYAAQKFGPDSPQAMQSLVELDAEIGKLVAGLNAAYSQKPLWIVASEYAIVPVDHVTYPNRALREAELLTLREEEGREMLDVLNSPAWALVDHQFSHVFVRDRDAATVKKIAELFRGQAGIAEVLIGDELAKYALDHERSGDVVLISTPNSWQAYYWWLDDARAPLFAHTVDIHRKPGYDPVELFFDPVKKGIPLDASLVKGSHGAPVDRENQSGIVLSSQTEVISGSSLKDTEIADVVLRQFD